MDILDIVNNVVNKNEEKFIDSNMERIKAFLSEGKSVDDIATFLDVDSEILLKRMTFLGLTKRTISKKELTSNQIQNAVLNLYKGISMSKVASELKITSDTLENELLNRNYQKRWVGSNNYKVPVNLNEILRALNIDKKSVDSISHEFNIDSYVLNASLREIWVQETYRVGTDSYTKLSDELLLVTSIENGELKSIIYKEEKLITGLEINELLGINTRYYLTLEKRKFVETLHFYKIDKGKLYKIKYKLPHLEYLVEELFYSKKGLELFTKITNKEGVNSKAITEYFDSIEILSTELIEKKENDKSQEKYSVFFGQSHPNGELGIIHDIVTELNKGFTIYDYSQKYAKSRKFRAKFSANMQKKIEDAGFRYSSKSKKWEKQFKRDDIGDAQNIKEKVNEIPIMTIVKFINEINSISKAEKEFGISSIEIRLLLKENGFSYDSLFKKWTLKSREQLLEETSKDLISGKINFHDLEKNGVVAEALKKKFDEVNLPYSKIEVKNKPIEGSDEVLGSDKQNTSSFTEKEIKILRELISEREKKSNFMEEKNDGKMESIVLINKSLLSKIEIFSDVKEMSRSKVIETALIEYFEKNSF
ncbi:hypothetical protein HF078_10740 [Bacillus sp. RO2]|uniref:hypothetical protein n=1 Tax=Bacillus sp. RO2 TaxID=2723913 RepID=UPI00145E00AF|nr:hypothetical protein [Bacillus sp. RO2]NMH73553.1 hypothetical protein [Bacillus sp. RO2]